MSSFKASATTPRLASVLKHTLCAAGLSLAVSVLSTQAHAGCQYVVTNDWGNGYTALIKITNSGTTAINGWTVSWQYSGNNRVTNAWSTTLTGSNPYSGTNLSWNANIQPNQTVEFGFQGTKSAGAAEIPVVTGTGCGTASSASSTSRSSSSVSTSRSSSSISSSRSSSISRSSSSSSRSSSSVSSSRSSSSISSSRSSSSSSVSSSRSSSSSSSASSVATTAAWTLKTTDSHLNFVTTKNTHVVEVHNFTGITADISTASVATLTIDLNTGNTGVALRDQRLRELLFETGTYPTATVTVSVPSTLISGLAVGQSVQTSITGTLNLHGVSGAVAATVSVQKLSNSKVLVQSLAPVLVKAGDYSLTAGVEALRAAVGIASISVSVPVDFALVFDAR
jgi:polyisoprenoid-binding protein YceI